MPTNICWLHCYNISKYVNAKNHYMHILKFSVFIFTCA